MSGLPIALPPALPGGGRSRRSRPGQTELGAGTVGAFSGSSARLGQRQLAGLRERLSNRDMAVLRSVLDLRLASSHHVETLHYADAATPTTAGRKARRTLQRLVDLGLLRRLERMIGGVRAGSAAHIYATTSTGQRLLADGGARRRLSEPSSPFVAHTLAVADLFVALRVRATGVAGAVDGGPQLLDLQVEPGCWRRWTNRGGGREVLRPDLYLAAVVGTDEVRWFIEVDRATEHRPALIRKASAYQRYYEAGIEQDRDGLFPRVAWVVPHERRAKEVERTLLASHITGALHVILLDESAPAALLA